METKTSYRYIVADPVICHGEPTFRGHVSWSRTYWNRLKAVWHWGAIIEEWRYEIDRDVIAEAVRMGREALVAYAPKLVLEPVIA